jgi:hypothetical protein
VKTGMLIQRHGVRRMVVAEDISTTSAVMSAKK